MNVSHRFYQRSLSLSLTKPKNWGVRAASASITVAISILHNERRGSPVETSIPVSLLWPKGQNCLPQQGRAAKKQWTPLCNPVIKRPATMQVRSMYVCGPWSEFPCWSRTRKREDPLPSFDVMIYFTKMQAVECGKMMMVVQIAIRPSQADWITVLDSHGVTANNTVSVGIVLRVSVL